MAGRSAVRGLQGLPAVGQWAEDRVSRMEGLENGLDGGEGVHLHIVPVRIIPRTRTRMGTTRVQVRRSTCAWW